MDANRRTCKHTKADGARCRAVCLRGSEYCWFHDPSATARRTAAQRAGGRNGRAAVLPPDTPERKVRTAIDVIGLLNETINEIRVGKLDPRVGNCIGYLGGIVLKALEQGDMETRLAALEAIVAGQRQGGRRFDVDPDELIIEGEERGGDALPQGVDA